MVAAHCGILMQPRYSKFYRGALYINSAIDRITLKWYDFVSRHQPPTDPFIHTRAGLALARSLGRKGGRKRQMTESKIASVKKLLANGVPPQDVAKNLGVSVLTLYRWLPASAHA